MTYGALNMCTRYEVSIYMLHSFQPSTMMFGVHQICLTEHAQYSIDSPLDRAPREHVKCVVRLYNAIDVFGVALDIALDRVLREDVIYTLQSNMHQACPISAPDT